MVFCKLGDIQAEMQSIEMYTFPLVEKGSKL